ncbi:hypothetical protein Nepgr_001581 [Nepenthes gracilis]|uniref:Uncharacterized protein n=1 Tax=Nepenthes gracilis TaxID=150966 RepID=A0AAD3P5E9_NEPGR|nr:hypothetical protein Nepgr_001581 [Nepenthes gracilis]
MEVDEKPSEDYNDIGGLEKQIQELVRQLFYLRHTKSGFKSWGFIHLWGFFYMVEVVATTRTLDTRMVKRHELGGSQLHKVMANGKGSS